MDGSVISALTLYRLRLPLQVPYRLSYFTFTEFEPILVVARDQHGRCGFGEGHISPGSSSETRAGGWAFCRHRTPQLVGLSLDVARRRLSAEIGVSPVAATALLTALEMLAGHPLLEVTEPTRLPLLTAFNARQPETIEAEVEQCLAQGFRTFKLKVGTDVDADLARVAAVQRAVAGRASLRIDANRGYSRADGCRFAAALDPAGVELFEQPCAADDWRANAAVAAASSVPLMLDEPICSLSDIERAAGIDNVGLCKLKLKRFGGLERLATALRRVRELGMEPVLGDGLAAEPGCWMEACVARSTIRNAGEFNGFLKTRPRLFEQPLSFEAGELVLRPGMPTLDQGRLDALTDTVEHYEV